ncbi:MAG: DMT family transporter [Candidatus Bipolaricaulia bacterium]
MPVEKLGEIAAIGTALLWSLTYVQFTIAARRIGPSVLNRLRLLFALAFLLCTHAAVYGSPLPLDVSLARWGWLILSGVIGFAISDALLFRALYHLGAHRTSLLMSLIPLTSALMAWAVFGERLTAIQMIAGLLTICGITLVVSGRTKERAAGVHGAGRAGVLFALGAVIAQSSRYMLSVKGMSGGFPPLSANVLQILAAATAVWAVAAVRRTAPSSFVCLRDRVSMATTIGGALTGPFLGVTFSLIALSRAPVGVASTLMALSPVFLLPISHFVFKEPVTIRATLGTGLAVAGVALLFLA